MGTDRIHQTSIDSSRYYRDKIDMASSSSSSGTITKRVRSTRVSVVSKSMRVVDADTRREAIERHLRSLELDNPGDSIDNYDGRHI